MKRIDKAGQSVKITDCSTYTLSALSSCSMTLYDTDTQRMRSSICKSSVTDLFNEASPYEPKFLSLAGTSCLANKHTM